MQSEQFKFHCDKCGKESRRPTTLRYARATYAIHLRKNHPRMFSHYDGNPPSGVIVPVTANGSDPQGKLFNEDMQKLVAGELQKLSPKTLRKAADLVEELEERKKELRQVLGV